MFASVTWQEVTFETNIFHIYLTTMQVRDSLKETKQNCHTEMLPGFMSVYQLNFQSDILWHRYNWTLFSSPKWVCFWSTFLKSDLESDLESSCLILLGQLNTKYSRVQMRLNCKPDWMSFILCAFSRRLWWVCSASILQRSQNLCRIVP